MSLDYLTPEEVAQQYLTHLKTLKPEVNTDQQDSDWWIRAHVVGGLLSGIYADQLKISNDPFPQSARREALEKSLQTYFGEGFKQATQSVGVVVVTGASGTLIPSGTQMQYTPNGNLYSSTELVDMGAATSVSVPVQSVSTGQNQNLLAGAALNLTSPPAGINPTAMVLTALSDGRDEETNDQAAARILLQIRTPLAGGKVSDYEQFALAADPSVTSATILRFPFGFGTVGVVITAGTTDIDEALDNDLPVILIPSDDLIQTVQDYVETQNPVTDCATVLAPASTPIDVTVNVTFLSGNKDTVLSGQTLTQGELVEREVQRALYKTPPGGRKIGASGFVLASEIEETIDLNLSAAPYAIGEKFQIIVDRQVQNLSATGANRSLTGIQLAVPGTITIVEV